MTNTPEAPPMMQYLWKKWCQQTHTVQPCDECWNYGAQSHFGARLRSNSEVCGNIIFLEQSKNHKENRRGSLLPEPISLLLLISLWAVLKRFFVARFSTILPPPKMGLPWRNVWIFHAQKTTSDFSLNSCYWEVEGPKSHESRWWALRLHFWADGTTSRLHHTLVCQREHSKNGSTTVPKIWWSRGFHLELLSTIGLRLGFSCTSCGRLHSENLGV